jgi:hypothetical protein
MSASTGSLAPKPAFRGPGQFPHKSLLGSEIWYHNGAGKRLRLRSKSGPQVRICVETGRIPQNAGFGTRDTQLSDKIGFLLGVGVPRGFPNVGVPNDVEAPDPRNLRNPDWRAKRDNFLCKRLISSPRASPGAPRGGKFINHPVFNVQRSLVTGFLNVSSVVMVVGTVTAAWKTVSAASPASMSGSSWSRLRREAHMPETNM